MQRRHVADVSRHRSMNRLRQSELLSSQLARKLGKAIQSLRNIENLISLRLGRIFVSGGQVSLPQGGEDRFWRKPDVRGRPVKKAVQRQESVHTVSARLPKVIFLDFRVSGAMA